MVFRNHEVDKQFFTPRDYQLELVEKARIQNIIVPLGTGSGKTFIAVMLIKEFAAEVLIPIDEGGKRSFFLVDKVSLVEQQAAHIEHQTNLTVGKFHGKMNVDYWDKKKWMATIKQHQVMVMTAQIFLHLIDHGLFSLKKVNLIIVDECHHALGRQHPYRIIIQRVKTLPPDSTPRILGLTASVINNKSPPHKLEALMIDLERSMNCKIETASDLVSVSKYGAKPRVVVVACEDFDMDKSSLCCPVADWLDGLKSFCRLSNQFHPDFDVDPRRPIIEALDRTSAILRQLGPWCAWKVCQIWEKQLKKLSKQPILGEWQKLFLQMGETYIRGARGMLEPQVKAVNSISELQRFLPGRVNRMLDTLRFLNPEVQKKLKQGSKDGSLEDFSAIIFVEQRYVAYIMKVLLKSVCKWDESNFGYLKVDFVIGYSGYKIASDETMALHKRQEEVLRKFRRRHLNLLVATSVLEEGVDVRQCNVVIRFDRPKDYRTFVQSKGRARKEGALYLNLVEQHDAAAFSQDLRDFNRIETILLNRYTSAHNPAAESFDPEFVDSLLPAYEVRSANGADASIARVSMTTAIALVNRYCAKLPSDIFTRLVPQSTIYTVIVNGQPKYLAELILPINSPVKEVIKLETPMERKKFAQMAVALKACQVLHERKELNDNLLPVGKDTIAKMMTQLDDDPDEWVPRLKSKVGSAKRKQLYDKRVSKALNASLPQSNSPSFIYVIDMVLRKPASKEANPKNRKITDPHTSQRCFGFLSRKRLPPVPAFPVFLRQGEVEVRIVRSPSTIDVCPETMQLLKLFHSYVFGQVLHLEKYGIMFQPEDAPISILIMPLQKVELDNGFADYVLDYTYVRNVVATIGQVPEPPSDQVRQQFSFDPADFVDAVVVPWYRNCENPHFYYVAEICTHLTPSSPFPDDQFPNFNEYFLQKYDLHIYDQTQPLLDVDYTSSRLNLLTPRFYNRHGQVLRSALERAVLIALDSSQRQILVPELVDRHPIHASLWNMIVALPTILYRLNCLLLADELRETVMTEAFGMDQQPDEIWTWPALNYGWISGEECPGHVQSAVGNRYTLATEHAYDKHAKEHKAEEKRRVRTTSFDIGIWNPELGDELDLALHPASPTAKQCDPIDVDTAGLMCQLNSTTNLVDDFEDEDDEIMFKLDFKNSVRERLCYNDVDLFEPREDIEPLGWDKAEFVVTPLVDNGDSTLPLQFVSVGDQFDANGLQRDVESRVTSERNQSGNHDDSSRDRHGDDSKHKPLWLDTMEMLDDCDRRRINEDVIDLSQIEDIVCDLDRLEVNSSNDMMDASFCTVDEPLDLTAKSSTARENQEEEEDGLEVKRRRITIPANDDHDRVIPEGQSVLAPEVDWMTFSFEENRLHKNQYGVSPCLLLQVRICLE